MTIKRQLLQKLNLHHDGTVMTYIQCPSLLSPWLSPFEPSLNFVEVRIIKRLSMGTASTRSSDDNAENNTIPHHYH